MTRVIKLPPPAAENLAARQKNAHEPTVAPGAPAIRTDAVYVVYTTLDETLAAIRAIAGFAEALGGPVTVVHIRTVPYVLPLDRPTRISPIETEGFIERLRADGRNVRLRVYLCRDEGQAAPFAFKPHSLIAIAGHRSWWPTRSQRLGRLLEAAGHFVVFVDAAENRLGGVRELPDAWPAAQVTKETSHA